MDATEEIGLMDNIKAILKGLEDDLPQPQIKDDISFLAKTLKNSEGFIAAFKRYGGIDILSKVMTGRGLSGRVRQEIAGLLLLCADTNEHRGNAVRKLEISGTEVYVMEKIYDPEATGFGWCMWGGARVLCRRLAGSPEQVKGKTVLELGSGVGLVGLFAGALGAESVTMTDYIPDLLDVLRINIVLNKRHNPSSKCKLRACWLDWGDEKSAMDSMAAAQSQDGTAAPPGVFRPSAVPSLPSLKPSTSISTQLNLPFFPKESPFSSASHLAPPFLSSSSSSSSATSCTQALPLMRTTTRNTHLPVKRTQSQISSSGEQGGSIRRNGWKQGSNQNLVPNETFDLILGSEILYSEESPPLLAAAVARRLAPRGRCELLLPIRKPVLLTEFVKCCLNYDLDIDVEPLDSPDVLKEVQSDGFVFTGGVTVCHIKKANDDLLASTISSSSKKSKIPVNSLHAPINNSHVGYGDVGMPLASSHVPSLPCI